MTKGVKVTSAQITISGSLDELGANTFIEEKVPLSLSILDREVLLVYAIDLNVSSPDAIAAVDTLITASMSTTSRTTIGSIANTNVLGSAQKSIRASGFLDGGCGFQEVSPETPASNALDFVGIVSTNDFFVQIKGVNNVVAKGVHWRMWCARATVSSDIYAALVQGEALSA